MGCCEVNIKNTGQNLPMKKSKFKLGRNKFFNIYSQQKLIINISEYLDIDDSIKLLNLNRMIRLFLPNLTKIKKVYHKISSKYPFILDINSLFSDISQLLYEEQLSDEVIIKSICVYIKKKILDPELKFFKIKVISKRCLELLGMLFQYIKIDHHKFHKFYTNKTVSLELSSNEDFSVISDENFQDFLSRLTSLIQIVKIVEIRNFNIQLLITLIQQIDNNINLLDISNNNLSFNAYKDLFELLKTNKSIKSVYMRNIEMTDFEVGMLCEVLNSDKKITFLELGRNKLGEESCKLISETLKINKTLISLYLGGNSLTNEGLKFLTDGLIVNKTLMHLDLSYNILSVESSVYLCVLLKMTKTLEQLLLVGNNFSREGIRNIFEGLIFNTSLKVLFLDNNKIGDSFGFQLQEVLSNKTLTTVSLSHNNFTDITAEYIYNALIKNHNITSINLNHNRITGYGVNLLINVIKDNPKFKNLTLTNNKYSMEVVEMLKSHSNKINFGDISYLLNHLYYSAEKYVLHDYFIK